MRQLCVVFVVSPERKICISKLSCTLEFNQFGRKTKHKYEASCRMVSIFNADLRQNLEF